jgi:hypothetical protein
MDHAERLTGSVTSMKYEFQILEASVSTSSAKSHRGGDNALTCARAADLDNFVRFAEDAQFDFGRPQLLEEARRAVAAAIAAGYDLSKKLKKIDEDAIWSLPDPKYSDPRRPGGNSDGPPHDPP